MTVTERLLKDTESIWAEYHQHPFVQGIADGTLDKEKFKYYMIQDLIIRKYLPLALQRRRTWSL